MPEISRFLGIIIYIHYKEHNPPHFHAKYGDYKIIIEIDSGVVTGKFPRRALNAVLDWYLIHKEELMQDWQLASERKALNKIEPLE
jgi:hypothetical protein